MMNRVLGKMLPPATPQKIRWDLYDKKICWELIQNARKPASVIAKTIRLSKETVLYRIKRLQQEEIIVEFRPRVNYPRLGYGYYMIFLHTTLQRERSAFLQSLLAKPYVTWVAQGTGRWDILLHCLARNASQMMPLLLEITKHPGIAEFDVFQVVDFFYSPPRYLPITGTSWKPLAPGDIRRDAAGKLKPSAGKTGKMGKAADLPPVKLDM